MIGRYFYILVAIALSALCSTSVHCRWIQFEQWKRTLRLEPNLETGEVTEDYDTFRSVLKISDLEERWTSGECINDIITKEGALLTKIDYYTGNPNPQFSFVLEAVAIYDGNGCMDPNWIFVKYGTEPGDKPQIFGGPGSQEAEADEIFEGTDNEKPIPVSIYTDGRVQNFDALNAPTLVEDAFERKPEDFDNDEVFLSSGMKGEERNSFLFADSNYIQGQEYTSKFIVEEEDEHPSRSDFEYDKSMPKKGWNSLRNRKSFSPRSRSDNEEEVKDESSPGCPGRGLIDVGTNRNDFATLTEILLRGDTLEEENLSDDSRVDPRQIRLRGTQPEQSSPYLPLDTQDVVDLESLVADSRDIPFEDQENDPTFNINILQEGLMFRKPTSIRLISDLSRFYRIPAGGIQTIY